MENRAHVREAIPVFADAALTQATVIHREACRATPSEKGETLSTRCTCGSGNVRVPAFTEVRVRRQTEAASLVELVTGPLSGARTWVETAAIHPGPAPRRKKGQTRRALRETPPDLTLLLTRREEGEKWASLRAGRRRRPAHDGDLVWIRGDDTEGPWRFLCELQGGGKRRTLLLLPEVRADQALAPAWTDVRVLDGAPEQRVVPVFPLPDGTASPGWRRTNTEPTPHDKRESQ